MTHDHKPAFSSGFGLLWRRQGVLWWIFVVNLICGALGTLPVLLSLHDTIGHSLIGKPLTDRFDIGMFDELMRVPNVGIMRFTTASYLFAFVFFVFMLFVTGGVLETYRMDQRLTTGEFFAASGGFFWRMVRLLLLSTVPFVIVGMIDHGLDKLARYVGDRAIADQVGIFMGWGGIVIFLMIALAVRLWFDIAQVRAVAQNERRMWRNTWRAWSITWHHFGGLYWMYFRIALLAWITLGLGLLIWTKLPAPATGAVFLIFQLIMFAQIATRLWQLAGAMAWYQQHPDLVPVEIVPVEALPVQEIAMIEPGAVAALPQEPVPASEAAPELPSPSAEPRFEAQAPDEPDAEPPRTERKESD